MHLSDADIVMESFSANDANRQLREGWKLLAVVATTRPSGDIHACYVLGKAKENSPVSEQQGQTA